MSEQSRTSRARSYLYVPADRADRLAKVATRGADAIIVDLEDAVHERHRVSALAGVIAWLDTAPPPPGIEIWVRVEPGSNGLAVVEALADRTEVAGFYLAKTEQPEFVRAAADLMAAADRTPAVVPLLESARAVAAAASFAALPGVVRIQVGEADLRAELGITLSPDERELLAVRTAIVLASAAAGLGPPVAPVDIAYADEDGFAHRTELLRRMGFFGRACIHPRQVPIANRIFGTSAAELVRAKAVLAALEASGGAATTGPDGEMIDEAIARHARRILDEAGGTR